MFPSIKSKLASTTSLTTTKKKKHAHSIVISGLQTTLQIAKEAAGDAGVPGLQAGIDGLLFVLDVIKVDRNCTEYLHLLTTMQKTSQNAEDIEKLAKQIEQLNLVLENSKSRGTLSAAVIDRIDRLFQCATFILLP
jgi:hypothetical protein